MKRALLNNQVRDSAESDKDETKTSKPTEPRKGVFQKRAGEISSNLMHAVKDAIDAGYGHAAPLSMTFHLGSEYGRHRSIVLCEVAATALRSLLRKNEANSITQPVSVSTRHRDVDKAHRDDEAFGIDLKLEARAVDKQRKREERGQHKTHW